MDKLVELVINEFTNSRQKVKSGMPQRLSVSSILFLIYISRECAIVGKQLPNITYELFINDLGFIIAERFISKIAKTLKKVTHILFEWGTNNAVIYDMSRMEIILFSKARQQKLTRILEIRIRVGKKTVLLKKDAIK